VFFLLACTGGPDTKDPGVIFVNNRPVWGNHVRLHEELRVGQLEGPPEYTLGLIGAMAVGNDGSIFVYDAAATIISRFDSTGSWVADLGREGSGPGEYRRVNDMRTLPDGQLAIWDARLGRITVYDTSGRYAESHQVPSGLHAPRSFEIDTAGNFYVMSWDPQVGIEGEIPKFFIKVSATGHVMDTIPLPQEDQTGPRFVVPTAEGWRYPFPHATKWAWSPFGYLITGRNTEYAFTLHVTGGLPLRLSRTYTPVMLTNEERRIWQKRIDGFFEEHGRPDGPAVVAPSGAGEESDLPDVKPAYRNLWTDDNGRVWIERYVSAVTAPVSAGAPDSSWREPPTFDVIEPDGTFLGTVVLPPNTIIYVRRDDRVWCVQTGQFDEPYVVRFRIVASG
jgi:hypothetical protein